MTLLICCWTTFTCVHYWCSSLKAKTICLIGNSLVSSRINIIPGADCTIICLSVWSLVTSQPAWNVKLDFLFGGLAKCLKPTKTKLVHPCWHFHHIWLLNVETEIFSSILFTVWVELHPSCSSRSDFVHTTHSVHHSKLCTGTSWDSRNYHRKVFRCQKLVLRRSNYTVASLV